MNVMKIIICFLRYNLHIRKILSLIVKDCSVQRANCLEFVHLLNIDAALTCLK